MCTSQLLYTAQHRKVLIIFLSYPPVTRHCSDVVYWVRDVKYSVAIITGPPTHNVVGRLVTSLSVIVVCNTRMQRNSPGGACCGPVVLRPVRATRCLINVALPDDKLKYAF